MSELTSIAQCLAGDASRAPRPAAASASNRASSRAERTSAQEAESAEKAGNEATDDAKNQGTDRRKGNEESFDSLVKKAIARGEASNKKKTPAGVVTKQIAEPGEEAAASATDGPDPTRQVKPDLAAMTEGKAQGTPEPGKQTAADAGKAAVLKEGTVEAKAGTATKQPDGPLATLQAKVAKAEMPRSEASRPKMPAETVKPETQQPADAKITEAAASDKANAAAKADLAARASAEQAGESEGTRNRPAGPGAGETRPSEPNMPAAPTLGEQAVGQPVSTTTADDGGEGASGQGGRSTTHRGAFEVKVQHPGEGNPQRGGFAQAVEAATTAPDASATADSAATTVTPGAESAPSIATAAPAAPPAEPQAPQEAPADQVFVQMRTMNSPGEQVVIRLDPPELGQVRITLEMDGEGMRGVLRVENPETLRQLQRESEGLMNRLAASGVQVRRLQVLPQEQTPERNFNDSFYRQNADAQQFGQSGQSGSSADEGQESGEYDGAGREFAEADRTPDPNVDSDAAPAEGAGINVVM